MSIPKEPRQIMINLMYLVLTALLALNVSNEILNAFKVLSKGISDSNVAIDKKTTDVYEQIKENEQQAGQAAKVKPFREKADLVVQRSNELMKYIDNWKDRIINESGGRDVDSSIKREDNIDATTHLLVEEKGGDTLRAKFVELRKFLLEQVMAKDTADISPLMPLKVVMPKPSDHNPTGDWNIGYFEHMPTIAAMAMFSKFQNDVRSSEALVISKLYEEAHLKEVKFDTIAAVAVPSQSYLLSGDKIQASILLAAFNRANKPEVTILQGGGQKKDAENGVVPWETVVSGTGLQTVRGTIKLATADPDHPIIRDWHFDYMVGTTGASLQLDKMNVFYIGVENPVTVAAAGYSVEDVSLDVPGGTIRDSVAKGHYFITMKEPGVVRVGIKAKTKDKGVVTVGGMDVRVKRIPNPVAYLNKINNGPMAANIFRIQIAPNAELENFEFAARYQIISFQFLMIPKGQDILGPYDVTNRGGARLGDNKDIKAAMSRAKAGDRVLIQDIKAIGPDGTTRKLNAIFISLN